MDDREFGRGLWLHKGTVGDPFPVRTLHGSGNERNTQFGSHEANSRMYLRSLLHDVRSEPRALAQSDDEIGIARFRMPWK